MYKLFVRATTSFLLLSESSRVRFLVQIRTFVIQTWSLGFPNFDMKWKTKRILVVAVKWRHRANGLLLININVEYQSWFSLVRNHLSRFIHGPLLRLINIPGVYSRRYSSIFGNGFVSIWSQGLVDVSGRSARVTPDHVFLV